MAYLFDQEVFATFQIESVDDRMAAIRSRIQPIFHYYAQQINSQLSEHGQDNLPIHIAKHLRRKVHPAKNTWVAVGGDKRGYKKYPHFQLGINPEYVFIVLAIIDNPPHEQAIADIYSQNTQQFEKLPRDMIVIPDHTALSYIEQKQANYPVIFERLSTIKQAEFMIGRLAKVGDPVLESQASTEAWLRKTIEEILPF